MEPPAGTRRSGSNCEKQTKVAIVDALDELDLEPLRPVFESEKITKIIHNAVFDANRLAAHYQFRVAPIFDTMVAARRNREPRYSLLAQAQAHLNIRLDKSGKKATGAVDPSMPNRFIMPLRMPSPPFCSTNIRRRVV